VKIAALLKVHLSFEVSTKNPKHLFTSNKAKSSLPLLNTNMTKGKKRAYFPMIPW